MHPKRKMQEVSFGSVEEFLDFLPPEELQIVAQLRAIVLECIPNCTEKLSYNVPYYKKHANICFIWPAAVKWGNSKQKGVRFGFTCGHLLSDETGLLDKGERKQVYWKDYFHLNEIDVPLLKSCIFEAVEIDKLNAANKRKKSKK